jgi:hypothetical protein
MRKLALTKERLLAKTVQQGECLLWTGHTTGNGYGGIKHRGRTLRAHRVSYELHTGPIPAGMEVLHRCDVPACVNPEHLFLGTHADNMKDKSAKGRVARNFGEANGRAKLTDEQVRIINERFVPRDRRNGARALAREFGVSHFSILARLGKR